MKKRLLMCVALALIAAMTSGCALVALYAARTADNGTVARSLPSPTAMPTSLPMEYAVSDALYEYEEYADGLAMESGMYMPWPEMPEMNTEEYASLEENGFRSVLTSPLSTFSADVDTASYCNLRRMINDGLTPDSIPAGAVRVEEMLNYFRYDYPAPADGEPFSVTAQIAACPWNDKAQLLMVGVKAAEAPAEAAEGGSNLVFLVDVSGSMCSSDKLELAQKALNLLVDRLGEKDSGEDIVIEGANPVRDREALTAAIDSLYASGSTNGERGLAQAYEVAQRYFRPGGNNRVIMCSDGDLNVGITSDSDLHDFVSEKRQTGIYLSVLGFGEGNYKDTKMETLADDGNGSYYYIDSILEARKVLCEEFTVADDVKFQIEFNPLKVASYRQVGYENRALEDADFENDEKDAGEVGSGASVTVLYELIPAGEGDADSGLKYQQSAPTEAAQGDEWLTVSLRYKNPGEDESRLKAFPVGEAERTEAPSGDFLFASAVAEFGLILRDSEFAGAADYNSVLELLKQAPLSDDYREEFFSLVKICQRNAALQG